MACGGDQKNDLSNSSENKKVLPPQIRYEFGYKLNDYKVIKDTIKNGESFGIILDRHHVFYPKINKIAKTIKIPLATVNHRSQIKLSSPNSRAVDFMPINASSSVS